MLGPLDLIQVIELCYRSSTTTLLSRASTSSVLCKEVPWIKSVVLNQIECQLGFVMMTVGKNAYVLHTFINIYYSFP